MEAGLDCMVPAFILQPLVENAIRYGADKKGNRHVSIKARTQGRMTEISVSDKGPGIPFQVITNLLAGISVSGVGLMNVHKRLKSIYGEENGLKIESSPAGARVWFLVPAPSSFLHLQGK